MAILKTKILICGDRSCIFNNLKGKCKLRKIGLNETGHCINYIPNSLPMPQPIEEIDTNVEDEVKNKIGF